MVQAAQKARAQIEAELGKMTKAQTREGKARANAAKRADEEAEKAMDRLRAEIEGDLDKIGDTSTRVFSEMTRESKTKFDAIAANFKRTAKDVEKEMNKLEKGSGGGGGGAKRGSSKDARQVGYWTMRNFSPVTPTLEMGSRIAGDLSRGAGVNMDPSALVASHVQRQQSLTDLSNAAYMPGDPGANGKRVSVDTLMGDVRNVGQKYGIDYESVGEGLSKFTAKTGDLDSGRKILADMAALSKATGANMDDVIDAAGDVSNALGDIPDKGAKIAPIMKALATQGKLGAVEMKDLATQMAKLGAGSTQFKVSKATKDAYGGKEDAEIMIAQMGALTQMARAKGGAASATQAATSIGSFTATFSKAKRRKEFKAAGIDVDNMDPRAIVLAALDKTKGDKEGMGKLFADTGARRAVKGFETVYSQTGGTHEQKMTAVAAEFDKLAKASMGEGEMRESLSAALETSQTHATRFNNLLKDVADRVAGNLLPAMERLAPAVERGANAFGDFLVWATSNPGKAIGAALAASFAKAAAENVIRNAAEKAFDGMKDNLSKKVDATKGGALGAAGAGLAIATLAIATAEFGMVKIDSYYDEKAKSEGAAAMEGTNIESLLAHIRSKGAMTKEEKAELESRMASVRQAKATEDKNYHSLTGGGGVGGFLSNAVNGWASVADSISGGRIGTNEAMAVERKSFEDRQKAQEELLKRIADTLASGIKVQDVTNAPPGVDKSGQMPANSPAGPPKK
jgi:hypothetical protein